MLAAEHPLSHYIAKLERRFMLPEEEKKAFFALPFTIVQANPHEMLTREGQEAFHCFFLASGFISRQKGPGGERHIVAVCVPGDAVDLQTLLFHQQDHSVVAHSRCILARIAHEDVLRMCDAYPLLRTLLWHDTLVDAAVFREWTLSMGHRRAMWRIAHLYLEMATRLRAQGLMDGNTFDFPFSQSELASMLGLSLVHFNKSLRMLRQEGMLSTSGRSVTLLNDEAMRRATGFNAGYLRLQEAPKLE